MPSPLGHALAGIAVGYAMAPALRATDAASRLSWPSPSARGAAGARQSTSLSPQATLVVACALAALAPDLDLLFGTHSTYTHSIGAVALVFVLALAVTSWRGWRLATALALAWATHLLLDWLGSDTREPIGIMALWPFTTEHYQSSLYLFHAISRRYWMPEQFILGNLQAAIREILVLGPLVWIAWWVGCRRSRGR